MDLNMPVMDGLEATRIVNEKIQNEEIPPTPIVALSAGQLRTTEEDRYYQGLGFAQYLPKPITKAAFTQILRVYHVLSD